MTSALVDAAARCSIYIDSAPLPGFSDFLPSEGADRAPHPQGEAVFSLLRPATVLIRQFFAYEHQYLIIFT